MHIVLLSIAGRKQLRESHAEKGSSIDNLSVNVQMFGGASSALFVAMLIVYQLAWGKSLKL